MDGHRRWAKSQGMPRAIGQKQGVESVRQVTEGCAEFGVSYLTLYAFSTENWNRPAFEINALMGLLVETVRSEIKLLQENNIRLHTIGDTSKLPAMSQKALLE